MRLVDEILASFPPAYTASVVLEGVDIALDSFWYPLSDIGWSDRYLVQGPIVGGVLFVEEIRFLEEHFSRQMAASCAAALEDPGGSADCPEMWLGALRKDAESE